MCRYSHGKAIYRKAIRLSDYCDPYPLSAVIVCGHVAKEGAPILLAVRDQPAFEEDSGWQLLYGVTDEEDESDAQVWSVKTAIKFDPSLEEIFGHPPAVTFVRSDIYVEWTKSEN